jgi:two-component system nitrogen regulation response regulator NtrX
MRSRGTRILVVDDEPDVREMIATLLAEDGYAVTTACDGETALRAIAATHFDVATMDLRMPGMSGRELLVAARALDPALAVIIVSGYATPEEAGLCRARGAVGVVLKPFDVSTLLDLIARTLAARPRVDGSAPEERSSRRGE